MNLGTCCMIGILICWCALLQKTMANQPVSPTVDPLWGYFSRVAGQDGQIDVSELMRSLDSSGIAGYSHWDEGTTKLLIDTLDRDRNGKMGFSEFKELWSALNQWKQSFIQFDRDHSGTLDPNEFAQALHQWGYRVSQTTIANVFKRYSTGTNNQLTLPQFVKASIELRKMTSFFQSCDKQRAGKYTLTLTYENYLNMVMLQAYPC